jgi:hypothetical protein
MRPQMLTWQETYTVQDEKIARLLAQGGQTLRYLAPFLGREASTKEASLETGIRLNVMAYWVKRLFDAGVLLQTRVQERRGSPIHYYRAVADMILIPVDLIESQSDTALLQQLQAFDYDDFSHQVTRVGRFLCPEWFIKYFRDGDTQGWTIEPKDPLTLEQLRQQYFHEWWYLNLDRAKAEELRQDLSQLLEKYAPFQLPNNQRKQYLLHIGFVQRD